MIAFLSASTLTGCFPVSQLCAVYMKETLTLLPVASQRSLQMKQQNPFCFLLTLSLIKAHMKSIVIWKHVLCELNIHLAAISNTVQITK